MAPKKKKTNASRSAAVGVSKSTTDPTGLATLGGVANSFHQDNLAVPILETGTHVEATSALAMFKDMEMTDLIDTVPETSTVQVMYQDTTRRDIIVISFGERVGFVSIVDLNTHRIVVDPKPRRSVKVDFRQLPNSTLSSPAVSAVLCGCVMKYDIAEGAVVDTLFLISVRQTEKINSGKVCEVDAKMKLIVLKIGEDRRVLVRPIAPGAPVGWVSAIDSKGRPLLGYRIAEKQVNFAELGARLEVKSRGPLSVTEEVDSEVIEPNVSRGTIVRVLQIPSVRSSELRVRVTTDPTNLTGWLPIISRTNEVILGPFIDEFDEDIDRFHAEAKRNNVDQLTVMIEGVKKGWLLGGGRKPVISDVNASNCQTKSALHYACAYGHVDATRYLVEKKTADVNLLDQFKRTAMHYAARRMPGAPPLDGVSIVQLLCNYRANPNEEDADGGTPLMYAAEKNHFSTAKLLLEVRATINHINVRRESALTFAAKQDNVSMVRYLLLNNADPSISAGATTNPFASASASASAGASASASAKGAASRKSKKSIATPDTSAVGSHSPSNETDQLLRAPSVTGRKDSDTSRKDSENSRKGPGASRKNSGTSRKSSTASRKNSTASRKNSTVSRKTSVSIAMRPSKIVRRRTTTRSRGAPSPIATKGMI
eukprot:GEMP01007144.1.p1 GENE.GEMP01007144.1~~GEMP01007144.1.p1  ORF type:complete len:655 (+),score=90.22 GEMP01007144.1:238-2202(+)